MSDQMIFKRYELKYLITKSQMMMLKKAFEEHMIEDEHGRSTICSLYFDTPDFLLARRSMEHPLYKEKLRLRSYGVASKTDTVFAEIKKKYDGVVYKRRISMKAGDAERYLVHRQQVVDTQISREIDFLMKRYEGIAPAVFLSYEREAFYGKEDRDFRVTFDENVLWRDYDLDMSKGIYGEGILKPGYALMEVKIGGAMPLWLARLLSENKIYKTSFSKYGNAYRRIFERKICKEHICS